MAVIASSFSFSPYDVMNMDVDDLAFWIEQAEWIKENG